VADLETALHTRLATFAPLTALVQTGGDPPRIYVPPLPLSTLKPAITHFRVFADRPAQAMGADGPIRRARFQVDSWGDSKSSAFDVAKQVHAALARFKGTSDGVTIHDVLTISDGLDLYEPDTKLHHIVQEFEVWGTEP
jgi:hypothetical protein